MKKKKKSFFGQRQNKHTHPHVFFLSGENCILEGHRFRNRIREIDKLYFRMAPRVASNCVREF